MEKTWKPVAAGILSIVGGAFNILVSMAVALFVPITARMETAVTSAGFIGALFLGTGVVALIGGISAIRRKRWGLSLAGAICAITPPSSPLGILSTVFVAMSRDEFEGSGEPGVQTGGAGEGSHAPPCKPDLSIPSEGERNA